ncbi:PIG-L deacetylase family protein [Meiothermus hypogaeus]|uniref:GlcNAc-PI de-N-acetylase n=1 Tax=Meiothermus hypogaeus NBRC 106114 TaxID=1227553 RepID=A0A511R7P7_9DEIN|nr:PIG-L family deacetylase [Meiothermus hypogaeus]GEM84986.1 GlcNAc-PI de-N-acetylase [Meiothermus hypogaeus NBRC 106114]
MRLLAVFPHPDDEIGVSGTLAKHVLRGDAAKILWLTRGELASQFGNTPPEEVARIREGHGHAVAEMIGAEAEFLNFADSSLTGGREEALAIARVVASWKPDVVVTWNPHDVHPDHRAAYWATLSALKFCRIPKLVGEPYRKPVRLLHYYRSDIPRPVVYVDVGEEGQAVADRVFGFYRDFYQWEYSLEAFRANRSRLGAEASVKFAERFQAEAPLAHPFLG